LKSLAPDFTSFDHSGELSSAARNPRREGNADLGSVVAFVIDVYLRQKLDPVSNNGLYLRPEFGYLIKSVNPIEVILTVENVSASHDVACSHEGVVVGVN
jgi:hypothetical protein